MAVWDVDALVTEIRDRAQTPSSSSTAPGYLSTDLLRRANGELLAYMLPRLLAAREEYLVTKSDTTMTVGDETYPIPTRASFIKLRDVVRVDSDGKEHNLGKITPEEVADLDPTESGTPRSYWIQGNTIHVYPVPDAADTLRIKYFRRPSQLVRPTTGSSGNIGLVSSANSTTIALQHTAPSTWGSLTKFDVISATPPFDTLVDDLTGALVAGNTLTFSGGVPSTLATGDYVCVAQQAPVVQLPVEGFYVLAQRVAVKLLTGQDAQTYADAVRERDQLEAAFFGAVEERNEGEPSYIVNTIWP